MKNAVVQQSDLEKKKKGVRNCRLQDTLFPVANTLKEADIGPELGQTLKTPFPLYSEDNFEKSEGI